MKNIRKLTYTGLLTALSMIIPIAFGFMSVTVGPFSATLTAHVPMFLSMFLGPGAAIMVGLGSAWGFFISKGAVIGARALMHVIVGFLGAVIIKKTGSFTKAAVITAPIHGILEALVVSGFILGGAAVKYQGTAARYILLLVGVGTILHHTVDAVISYALAKSISKAGATDLAKV